MISSIGNRFTESCMERGTWFMGVEGMDWSYTQADRVGPQLNIDKYEVDEMGLQGIKRSCMRISCVIAATRQSRIRKLMVDWLGLYRGGRHWKDAYYECIRYNLRMKANVNICRCKL